ncbi:MAG TPA: hypothetical protein VD994_06790 [Prosthecobacter sp.]|nr:hypothetical protein [Prosthecobacter sp.]
MKKGRFSEEKIVSILREAQERKKVASPSSRRRVARHVVDSGLGKVAEACRAGGLPRSRYYRRSRISKSKRQAPQPHRGTELQAPSLRLPPHYRADAA